MQVVDVAAMTEDKEQAKAKHSHDVGRQWQKEEEKVPVVPPADTVVHPWTVVIKVLWRIQEEKNHTNINVGEFVFRIFTVQQKLVYC